MRFKVSTIFGHPVMEGSEKFSCVEIDVDTLEQLEAFAMTTSAGLDSEYSIDFKARTIHIDDDYE